MQNKVHFLAAALFYFLRLMRSVVSFPLSFFPRANNNPEMVITETLFVPPVVLNLSLSHLSTEELQLPLFWMVWWWLSSYIDIDCLTVCLSVFLCLIPVIQLRILFSANSEREREMGKNSFESWVEYTRIDYLAVECLKIEHQNFFCENSCTQSFFLSFCGGCLRDTEQDRTS